MVNSVLDGTMIGKMHGMRHVCKKICGDGHSGLLENVSITLIDKTDSKDPKKRENYWMRTLKTYAPFGLYIEDSV